jgi:hypothetical protein
MQYTWKFSLDKKIFPNPTIYSNTLDSMYCLDHPRCKISCKLATVDREIFVVKKFSSTIFPMKIKHREIFCARYLVHYVLRTLVYATKIGLRENLISEIFYQRKFPDLRYNSHLYL